MLNRSKLGKQSKRKGYQGQKESADFWSKILGGDIRSTPRSGAFYDWPGDLIDMGNSILKQFVIERKYGKTVVPKGISNWLEKLGDEAQGKPHFLEISEPYQETIIIIKRKYFARILKELQGYQEDAQKGL